MVNTSTCFKVLSMDEIAGLSEPTSQKNIGFVYAMEYGGKIKIGCSKRPHFRIPNLLRWANKYGGIETGRVCLSCPHTNYREMESFFHRRFSDLRVCGTELFDMGLDDFMRESEKHKSRFKIGDPKAENGPAKIEKLVEKMLGVDRTPEITREEKDWFANNLEYVLERVKERAALYNKCVELLEELCSEQKEPSTSE